MTPPLGQPRSADAHAPTGADDYALMEACARGDESALSQLFDRHGPVVLALARRILTDATEAEELLVELFWDVWRRADQYDPSRATPLTYLMTMTRSRAIDRRRAAQSRAKVSGPPSPVDPPTTGGPLDDTLGRERREIVREALDQLEPDQRQALECSYYEGLTHTEIAARLNRPLGTVKGWIRQGLGRLRDQLGRRYYDTKQNPGDPS